MKNKMFTTMLAAVFATLFLADAASAYYSPRMGRFLNRDPIGETGAMLIRTGVQPATRFIPRDNVDKNGYAGMLNNAISWFDPDGGEATSQPAPSPASQPTPKNYLDPTSRLGAALAGKPTTCGIYVIRDMVGVGHTFILWDGNGIGWSGDKKDGKGGNGQQDTQHVESINNVGNAFAAWAVDYRPKVWVRSNREMAFTDVERRVKYTAGEPAGKCCPDTPNCSEIKQCLEGLIGTPHGLSKPWGPPYDGRANCNSFAHQALSRCCLKRGALLVNPGISWNPWGSGGANMSWWWVNEGWGRGGSVSFCDDCEE